MQGDESENRVGDDFISEEEVLRVKSKESASPLTPLTPLIQMNSFTDGVDLDQRFKD